MSDATLTPRRKPDTPETMPLDAVMQFAKDVGAPTVIVVLIILRIEKRLDDLTRAIMALPPIFAEILARHLRAHNHTGPPL